MKNKIKNNMVLRIWFMLGLCILSIVFGWINPVYSALQAALGISIAYHVVCLRNEVEKICPEQKSEPYERP